MLIFHLHDGFLTFLSGQAVTKTWPCHRTGADKVLSLLTNLECQAFCYPKRNTPEFSVDRTSLLCFVTESEGETGFYLEAESTAFAREKTGNFRKASSETYKSMFVRNVVGEFQFVESDNFGHPLFPSSRAVRVNVHSLRHFRISLSCYHPPGIVKFIATVIRSDNVHQQNIFGFFIQPRTPYFKWRKHSPTKERGGKKRNGGKKNHSESWVWSPMLKYFNQI